MSCSTDKARQLEFAIGQFQALLTDIHEKRKVLADEHAAEGLGEIDLGANTEETLLLARLESLHRQLSEELKLCTAAGEAPWTDADISIKEGDRVLMNGEVMVCKGTSYGAEHQ